MPLKRIGHWHGVLGLPETARKRCATAGACDTTLYSAQRYTAFCRNIKLQTAALQSFEQPITNQTLYKRFAEPRLIEALSDSPIALIHGPRQCGKTTLAQMVCSPEQLARYTGSRKDPSIGSPCYTYLTFDDAVTRGSAEADPTGFVADLQGRAILDEVQRVPGLFEALKVAVDRGRTMGRFLLTGSSNVFLTAGLSDSLAGRMETVQLHPLAQCELEGARANGTFLDDLFGKGFGTRRTERLGRDLSRRIASGGYPAALARPTGRRRGNWYRDYVNAQVLRDVRDLARIRSVNVLPRLMALAAANTATLFNLADLAAPFELSRPTIRDYVTLLEQVFLLGELPSWHDNRARRLVKRPKLHVGDTGLACALMGIDADGLVRERKMLGRLLETFVYREIQRQASWNDELLSLFHFRDRDGLEVGIVIEKGAQAVAGVQVKAGSSVAAADFRGLRKLSQAAGNRFVRGVVLYDGEISASYGNRLHAVPIRALWERL